MLRTLQDLVSLNSVNPHYPGGVPELQIADYVQEFFRECGIESWRQQVYVDRPNIIARIPGRNPQRRVVLEAHLDTVSVEGMEIEPFLPVIEDGKLFGRGACDTKGGLAAMMHAMRHLASESGVPPYDVIFAATIDEEHSYRGVAALCDSLDAGPVRDSVLDMSRDVRPNWQADVAIVAEPTELKAVIASKGLVRWKIAAHGKAAHSARPHLGASAIEATSDLVLALRADTNMNLVASHPLLGQATCNVGIIRGGRQVNQVPDYCEIEIDRRMLPGENTAQVLEHYQRLTDAVGERHEKVKLEMFPPTLWDPALETSATSPPVAAMLAVLAERGLPSQPCGVPFCSDASKLAAGGIPSLIFGPGCIDQAHAAVEFVDCEQVMEAAQVYWQFLTQYQ